MTLVLAGEWENATACPVLKERVWMPVASRIGSRRGRVGSPRPGRVGAEPTVKAARSLVWMAENGRFNDVTGLGSGRTLSEVAANLTSASLEVVLRCTDDGMTVRLRIGRGMPVETAGLADLGTGMPEGTGTGSLRSIAFGVPTGTVCVLDGAETDIGREAGRLALSGRTLVLPVRGDLCGDLCGDLSAFAGEALLRARGSNDAIVEVTIKSSWPRIAAARSLAFTSALAARRRAFSSSAGVASTRCDAFRMRSGRRLTGTFAALGRVVGGVRFFNTDPGVFGKGAMLGGNRRGVTDGGRQ